MTDPAAAWLTSMIRHGEVAIALRQGGHTWRAIADELHLGDIPTVQRAAAMFLAADYESRMTAGEAGGRAQGGPATDGPPAGERVTTAAG